MDDDVVFFAMVQRYNIYFKYVSLRHDIWIVMVLSHPRRISTEPVFLRDVLFEISEHVVVVVYYEYG